MGFYVDIGPNAAAISKRLRVSPYSIFEEPFAGYLLFLFDDVSADDLEFKNWFEKHVKPLHMMTGKEIAFAVFAHRVDVRVHPSFSREYRPPTVKEVWIHDTDRDYSIEKMIFSGRCGNVVDGDEIRVINEAVYDLAREFGVFQMLPCIVALDGLPDPARSWTCLPAPKYELSDLFGRLRSAVGRLQATPGLPAYQSGLRALRDKARQLEKLELQIHECRSSFDKAGEEKRFQRWLSDVRRALERGEEAELGLRLKEIARHHPRVSFADDFTAEFFPVSASLASTMRELGLALKESWPLQTCDKQRLSDLYDKRIRALLDGEQAGPSFDTRSEVGVLINSLNRVRAAHTREAMEKLPSLKDWMEWAEAEWYSSVSERLQRYEDNRVAIAKELYNSAKAVLAMNDRPSWCQILEDEFHEGCLSQRCDELPRPSPSDASARLLDWVPLAECISHLKKLDFLALLRAFRRLLSEFGPNVWTRNPTAFASYASSDRPEVLRRVQGMRAFQPDLDIFLDFHSLNPGDEWRNRLSEEIERRDRFFLFWSRAASRSPHVMEEYRTADRLGKRVEPVPLCSPHEAPPPRELERLHFGDRYLEYLRCTRPP
jgi:hypothetical protein